MNLLDALARACGRPGPGAERDEAAGDTGFGVTSELIVMSGHSGTHLDGPGHASRHEGVTVLPDDYAIGARVLARIAAARGLDVRPGDYVMVRTGLGASWHDRAGYPLTGSIPGLDASGGEWLADRGVRLVGADNVALEELAAADPDEFLFVCLPLKLRGASGSPVRPVAVLAGPAGG